jgi:hypothetical protein
LKFIMQRSNAIFSIGNPTSGGIPMLRKLAGIIGLAGILTSFGALSTVSAAGDDVAFPTGFRNWFVVNSMIVTKDSPMFSQIGGMHIIYVNAKGRPIFEKGGPLP